MIHRRILPEIQSALQRQAAVALMGPRQVGKTTLALTLGKTLPSLYLDLENPADRQKLNEPVLFLSRYEDQLVILDEIHRAPELFQSLRGIIDSGRRSGRRTGRFLLLGSASIDLLRQSGESLAGRIAYVDMTPLDVLEVADDSSKMFDLWIRGGFPDSFLAGNEASSLAMRRDFIRTYLERDIPMFGPRLPAHTMERLWTMLAHVQGTLLNASRLAASLGVSSQTVTRYIDLLADLLLVRRLAPFHANLGKRLVKSPKVYVRDSGLLHALLDISNYNELAGHPVAGASWEVFVIENILAAAPVRTRASFFRTSAGAEIDLLLRLPGGELWAVEIKNSLSPRLEKGFHLAHADLKPSRSFAVYPGNDRYPINKNVDAISLLEICTLLAGMSRNTGE